MATPPPRRVIGAKWELHDQIGRGSFAVVWRAKRVLTDTENEHEDAGETTTTEAGAALTQEKESDDKSDAKPNQNGWVAVKEIATSQLSKKLLRSLSLEIDVLRSCTDENITRLIDIVQDDMNHPGYVYLVLEFCERGDVSALLKEKGALREKDARCLTRQIANGLFAMRMRNLIHRDLKPQNLLLTRSGEKTRRTTETRKTIETTGTMGTTEPINTSTGGSLADDDDADDSSLDSPISSLTLKIADFGFARALDPEAEMASTLCGSPLYMAPEILGYQKYDAKADLWSVGVILFELLCGVPPFTGRNPMHLLRNIERGDAKIPAKIAKTLSHECVDLLRNLLRKNPNERMEFTAFFNHPFVATGTVNGGRGVPSAGGRNEPVLRNAFPTNAFETQKNALLNSSDSDTDVFDEPGGIAITRTPGGGERRGNTTNGDGDAIRGNDCMSKQSEPKSSITGSWKKGFAGASHGFSLPAGNSLERAFSGASTVAKEAGQWLGSSPLGRRAGTSFQKFIGASKPRFEGLHSESAGRMGNEIGAEHDEEYVFVDPRGFRDGGTLVLPPNVFPQSEVPSPRPEGRDVAGDKPSADAVTSDALCSVDVEKKKALHSSAHPSSGNQRPQSQHAYVMSLERAARVLRDAAGEQWDKGKRLDALAMSVTATTALRRARALVCAHGEEHGLLGRESVNFKNVDFNRLDAAYVAALRRAETAFSCVLETQPGASNDQIVPNGMRCVYDTALAWGRAGAAEALVGESGAAASNFARAECLLEFLLTEGPDGFGMDDTEVSVHEVPRDAWAGRHPDRDRVAKFATALAVRRAACADG